MDALADDGQIGVTEWDQVYESTFLAATALFEHFLEESLVCVVCATDRPRPGRGVLIKPASKQHFERLLFGNREYVDLLPYKRTVDLAELYLRDGRPFTELSDQAKSLLTEAVAIRHAIAHRSRKSVDDFRRKVQGVGSLPPNRQFPGPFLRSVFRASPRQTRHELYFATYGSAANSISTAWHSARC